MNFEKENNKGFCVIDPVNEQHIVIREESHNWPNLLKSGRTVYLSFSTAAFILETNVIELILTITEAEVNTAHLVKCPRQNLVHFLCQVSLHFHMEL